MSGSSNGQPRSTWPRSRVVCTRTPHPSRPGARRSTVWTVQATLPAVRQLAAQLAREGIQLVTLESTSDYWRLWY
jgi:transposase